MGTTSSAGDTAAAVAQMRARLVAFVARRIDRHDDAEDVVQEVLLRISRSAGTLRDSERLDAWAYRIARNAIIDHQRATVRSGRALTRAAFDRSLGAGDSEPGELAALAGCLAPMLARLSERDRRAIELVDYGGLTQAEAAHRLDVSLPGMKSRIQRARARLRSLLLECCEVSMNAGGTVSAVRPAGPCPCGG
ncbi:sigma-70 family RNA polymerase sigma factor [Nonomuraea rhodomycinica]|uniref:Sigma-70 family RNA polymerase sigma factor n=1 Tax=Nonomuraea rhodomycinica TaxID=1712872 RepID=A0A7Y6INK7_9ACTN|nr:sigma-70 family RNA polymerase sigma factor [Nonomuraea rhodomycinica]NUW41241.1 sigma-70 family RNA polymerase sigma factor [Nonomuraea rhodomycinica]